MPQLHPLIPAGPFDLVTLLAHEPPVRWRPEPGERVTGELVRLVDKTSFGQSAPTLYLLVEGPDDGPVRYITVRASGVVLRNMTKELKPRTGEQVALKFEGLRASAAGHTYALYRMAVRRGGSWVVAQ
jgi:hypothetical protein